MNMVHDIIVAKRSRFYLFSRLRNVVSPRSKLWYFVKDARKL